MSIRVNSCWFVSHRWEFLYQFVTDSPRSVLLSKRDSGNRHVPQTAGSYLYRCQIHKCRGNRHVLINRQQPVTYTTQTHCVHRWWLGPQGTACTDEPVHPTRLNHSWSWWLWQRSITNLIRHYAVIATHLELTSCHHRADTTHRLVNTRHHCVNTTQVEDTSSADITELTRHTNSPTPDTTWSTPHRSRTPAANTELTRYTDSSTPDTTASPPPDNDISSTLTTMAVFTLGRVPYRILRTVRIESTSCHVCIYTTNDLTDANGSRTVCSVHTASASRPVVTLLHVLYSWHISRFPGHVSIFVSRVDPVLTKETSGNCFSAVTWSRANHGNLGKSLLWCRPFGQFLLLVC